MISPAVVCLVGGEGGESSGPADKRPPLHEESARISAISGAGHALHCKLCANARLKALGYQVPAAGGLSGPCGDPGRKKSASNLGQHPHEAPQLPVARDTRPDACATNAAFGIEAGAARDHRLPRPPRPDIPVRCEVLSANSVRATEDPNAVERKQDAGVPSSLLQSIPAAAAQGQGSCEASTGLRRPAHREARACPDRGRRGALADPGPRRV